MNCDFRQAAGNHGESIDRALAAIPGTRYACRRGFGFSHGFRIGDSRQFRFDAGFLTEDTWIVRCGGLRPHLTSPGAGKATLMKPIESSLFTARLGVLPGLQHPFPSRLVVPEAFRTGLTG